MNCLQVSLAVFGLILVVGVHSGLSVTHCFVCNSASQYEGEQCLDPFDVDTAKNDGLYKDCGQFDSEFGLNFTYCRKMAQDVEGDYRVIRQCASNVREKKLGRGVERTGTKDIRLSYYDCEGDGCNSAPAMLTVNALVLFAISGLLALIFQS